MRYPADMIVEITKEFNDNVEKGNSVIDFIDTAYGIARRYGFCGLDPVLEGFVRACYRLKIGPEACSIIDQEVLNIVRVRGGKDRAVLNAKMEILSQNLPWTETMEDYAGEAYYRAYAGTIANQIN